VEITNTETCLTKAKYSELRKPSVQIVFSPHRSLKCINFPQTSFPRKLSVHIGSKKRTKLVAWNRNEMLEAGFADWVILIRMRFSWKISVSLSIRSSLTFADNRCEFTNTRWFKYDRDWFVCKQAALRSSCATLREWSHNLHPPFCSG